MADQGALADAAFEVLDGHDQGGVTVGPARPCPEEVAHRVDVGERVALAPTRRRHARSRQPPVGLGLADRLGRSPHHLGRLADGEAQVEGLLGVRREHCRAQPLHDRVRPLV